MLGVMFRPVEIHPELSLLIYRITIVIFMVLVAVWYIRMSIRFFRQRKSDQEFLRLKQEWWENGTNISQWLKDHVQESRLNFETTISNLEF